MSMLAEPQVHELPELPVEHLSVSSLTLFTRDPEAWRRRYIEHAYEPASGKMVLGSAAGSALTQHYAAQLETGEGYSTEQLLDEFDAVLGERADREEVNWENDEPGTMKDKATRALALYHAHIAPTVTPAAVERQFELSWLGVPFVLTGYIDVETAADRVIDTKMTGKSWGDGKVAAALQPTVYLAARAAEGDPAAGFDYHLMVYGTKQPTVPVIEAHRTPERIAGLTGLVFSIAAEISWRWREDVWRGVNEDSAWMCKRCAHHGCNWRLS